MVHVKVKLILFFFVSCFVFSVNAQNSADSTGTAKADSTQIKLNEYKKLLDSEVIGVDEYNKMKSQLLGNATPETGQSEIVKPDIIITRADTMPMRLLKDRYKARVVAGAVILSVGGAFIVGDIVYASIPPKLPKPNSTNADTISSEKATHVGSSVALGVIGGLAAVGGSVFLALGLKDKATYRRRGKELSMNFTGKEIEIAFVF
jgi:hypothetical protein